MSDNIKVTIKLNDYPTDYKEAEMVIKILTKHKVISGHSNKEEYLKIWDAALEIARHLYPNEVK